MSRALLALMPATRRGRVLLGAVVLLVLGIPLFVALGVLHEPRWFPLLDIAQTELRVRDVASSHPPLTGLAGRIGTFGQQGSHPGPLSFWALWPAYQLTGASSWSLEAAAVALNLVAMGLALWLAYRRGGAPLLLAFGLGIAVLTRAYGPSLLTQPWNPYLPMMWWFAFLVAVWCVLCDDLPALPVVVFAGSFCMQTHVSYVGLIGGLGAVAVGYVALRARRGWGDREVRTESVRWGLVSIGVGVLLWLPPVLDQLFRSGNLRVLLDYFTDPPESAIGPADGLEALLINLSPWRLVVGTAESGGSSGSVVPGILLILAWVGAALVAWRVAPRALRRLHVVVGIALVLGLISASRIFGFVWYYLLLWAAGVATLMLLAIGWSIVSALERRAGDQWRSRAVRAGPAVLATATLVVSASFVVDATSVEVPTPRHSETLGAVVPATAGAVAALPESDAPYLVTWLPDPLALGGQGYGLLNELERRGLDVKAEDIHINGATPYRIINRTEATVEIHLAVGPEIDVWRDKPGFEEVAYFDPRTKAERAESERLREQIIDELNAAGLSERVPLVDENLFVLTFDTRIPDKTLDRIEHIILDLGMPAAVFIGPPGNA